MQRLDFLQSIWSDLKDKPYIPSTFGGPVEDLLGQDVGESKYVVIIVNSRKATDYTEILASDLSSFYYSKPLLGRSENHLYRNFIDSRLRTFPTISIEGGRSFSINPVRLSRLKNVRLL